MKNITTFIEKKLLDESTMNIMFVHIQGMDIWKKLNQEEKKKKLIEIHDFYNPNVSIPIWLKDIVDKNYVKFPELILPPRITNLNIQC